MDTQDTRRMMLRKVIADRFDGKAGYLADATGRDRPTISTILSGKRVFGEALARDIERRLELSELYLDGVGKDELEMARLICQLPADRQQALRHYLESEVAIFRHQSIAAERAEGAMPPVAAPNPRSSR